MEKDTLNIGILKGEIMPSPEQIVIARKRFPDSGNTLCLDRVIRHDEYGRIEYAFGWRNPNNSVLKIPAYFDWAWAGELIKQAIDNNELNFNALGPFFRELIGLHN